MGRHLGKVYDPFTYLPPCVCPKCYKPALAYKETDKTYGLIGEDGTVIDFIVKTSTIFHCMECGFTSEDFIMTDSGFRYNPHDDAEYIRKANQTIKDDPYNPEDKNFLVKKGKGFKYG